MLVHKCKQLFNMLEEQADAVSAATYVPGLVSCNKMSFLDHNFRTIPTFVVRSWISHLKRKLNSCKLQQWNRVHNILKMNHNCAHITSWVRSVVNNIPSLIWLTTLYTLRYQNMYWPINLKRSRFEVNYLQLVNKTGPLLVHIKFLPP